MADLHLRSLDAFPDAALLISKGQIISSNAMARHYLSIPPEGGALPPCLSLLAAGDDQSGTFSTGLSVFTFRSTPVDQGLLVLFHPAPQQGLTDLQLDGTLRQMRTFLNEFLVEVEDNALRDSGAFHKTFHRMYRLMDNLELLRAAATEEDLPFQRLTLDLAGLCRRLVMEAASLLKDIGICLEFRCALPSLLIPGDPALLQKLILELISNSTRSIGHGNITLELRLQGSNALLILSDSGTPLSDRQLSAMLQQDTDQRLPLPNAGAGLGLSVSRTIIARHGGALLVQSGSQIPTVVLSLPTGPLDPRTTVNSPAVQRDGGLSPMLVALSDVLPAQLFQLVSLD